MGSHQDISHQPHSVYEKQANAGESGFKNIFVVILSQLEGIQLFNCKFSNKIKHRRKKYSYPFCIIIEVHSLSMTCGTNKIIKETR